VALGCGISNPSCVKFMIYSGADAVIVGSAIIKKIKDFVKKKNCCKNQNLSLVTPKKTRYK
jgi:tryptophan synthase alpha subunit